MTGTKILKIIDFDKPEGSTWYHAINDSSPFPDKLTIQPTISKRIKTSHCLSNFKWFSGLVGTRFKDLYLIDTYRLTPMKKAAIVSKCGDDRLRIFLLSDYPDTANRHKLVISLVDSSKYNLCK